MIPAGYAQASLRFTGVNVPTGGAVVFGVIADPSTKTPAGVATSIRDKWNTNIMPQVADDVTLAEVLVKFGPDETGPFASVAGSTIGSIVATAATPGTSFLVRKNTALGGRRNVGRMYIPGVTEIMQTDAGDLVAGTVASFQTALNTFLGALTTDAISMYVLHGPATVWELVGGQPRRVPTAGFVPGPTLVSSLTLQTHVAMQRRRLRR